MTEGDGGNPSMHISVRVDVKTREGGDYYFDQSDALRHVKMWIEGGLSDRDDIVDTTVTELPPDVPAEPKEPNDPAAHALAEYIASHPASTVMAACRYLGWKVTFDLQGETCPHGPERHGPEMGCVECRCTSITGHEARQPAACPQCGDTGACNGGPCPLLGEASLSTCSVCSGAVEWINCPTGGWWAHWNHPADGHDAQPSPGGCSAALLPTGSDPVEPCVVGNPRNSGAAHQVHRTAQGEAWVAGEEV